MRRLTKPPTPEEWSVIFGSSILLFVALGAVGIWYSLRAPAAKADEAGQLFWYSLAFWALAAGVYGLKRAVGFLNR